MSDEPETSVPQATPTEEKAETTPTETPTSPSTSNKPVTTLPPPADPPAQESTKESSEAGATATETPTANDADTGDTTSSSVAPPADEDSTPSAEDLIKNLHQKLLHQSNELKRQRREFTYHVGTFKKEVTDAKKEINAFFTKLEAVVEEIHSAGGHWVKDDETFDDLLRSLAELNGVKLPPKEESPIVLVAQEEQHEKAPSNDAPEVATDPDATPLAPLSLEEEREPLTTRLPSSRPPAQTESNPAEKSAETPATTDANDSSPTSETVQSTEVVADKVPEPAKEETPAADTATADSSKEETKSAEAESPPLNTETVAANEVSTSPPVTDKVAERTVLDAFSHPENREKPESTPPAADPENPKS